MDFETWRERRWFKLKLWELELLVLRKEIEKERENRQLMRLFDEEQRRKRESMRLQPERDWNRRKWLREYSVKIGNNATTTGKDCTMSSSDKNGHRKSERYLTNREKDCVLVECTEREHDNDKKDNNDNANADDNDVDNNEKINNDLDDDNNGAPGANTSDSDDDDDDDDDANKDNKDVDNNEMKNNQTNLKDDDDEDNESANDDELMDDRQENCHGSDDDGEAKNGQSDLDSDNIVLCNDNDVNNENYKERKNDFDSNNKTALRNSDYTINGKGDDDKKWKMDQKGGYETSITCLGRINPDLKTLEPLMSKKKKKRWKMEKGHVCRDGDLENDTHCSLLL